MTSTKTTTTLTLVLLLIGSVLACLFLLGDGPVPGGVSGAVVAGSTSHPASRNDSPAEESLPAADLLLASDSESRVPLDKSGKPIVGAAKGCITGRVLIPRGPAVGATVVVYRPGDYTRYENIELGPIFEPDDEAESESERRYRRAIGGKWTSNSSNGIQANKSRKKPVPVGVDVGYLLSTDRVETNQAGEFELCVVPGNYVLEVIIDTKRRESRVVQVMEGERLDLGDLEIKPGACMNELDEIAMPQPKPGTVTVHTGHPGLRVVTTFEDALESTRQTTTGPAGDALFTLVESRPLRIDLIDKHDFVLGSTDSFQAYSANGPTELFIPSVPGSLTIRLPGGVEALGGETYQVHLTRIDSPELDLRVKSIASKRIPLAEQGFTTSPTGLQYNALRTGAYEVKAIRQTVPAGASAPVNTGEWLRTTAHVFAGQETHCTLE